MVLNAFTVVACALALFVANLIILCTFIKAWKDYDRDTCIFCTFLILCEFIATGFFVTFWLNGTIVLQ